MDSHVLPQGGVAAAGARGPGGAPVQHARHGEPARDQRRGVRRRRRRAVRRARRDRVRRVPRPAEPLARRLVVRHRARAHARPRPVDRGRDPAVPAAAPRHGRRPRRLGGVRQAARGAGPRARRLPAPRRGPRAGSRASRRPRSSASTARSTCGSASRRSAGCSTRSSPTCCPTTRSRCPPTGPARARRRRTTHEPAHLPRRRRRPPARPAARLPARPPHVGRRRRACCPPGRPVHAVDLPGTPGHADRPARAVARGVRRPGRRRRCAPRASSGPSSPACRWAATSRSRSLERHPELVAGLALVDTKSTADAPEARANRLRIADEAESTGSVDPVRPMATSLLGRDDAGRAARGRRRGRRVDRRAGARGDRLVAARDGRPAGPLRRAARRSRARSSSSSATRTPSPRSRPPSTWSRRPRAPGSSSSRSPATCRRSSSPPRSPPRSPTSPRRPARSRG